MAAYTKTSPGAPEPGGLYSAGDLVTDSLNQVWKCIAPGRDAKWAPAPVATRAISADTTLTAADSGGTFILTGTTALAVALPALAANLTFEFILSGVPASGAHVITPATADKVVGRVFTLDGGTVGDTEDTLGGDAVNFVTAATVAGDRAKFWCDGITWYVEAHAKVPTGITITG